MPSRIKCLAGVIGSSVSGQARWLILAVIFAGVGFLFLSQRGPRPHRVSASVPRTFYVSKNTSLGLNLERQGDDLVLSWNRDALAIRTAVTGILALQAGGKYEDFVLAPQDLRSGKFTYRSAATQVNMRLHVYDANDRRTNDSALFSLPLESNRGSVTSPEPAAHSAETGNESLRIVLRPLRPVPATDRPGVLLRGVTDVSDSDPSGIAGLQLAEPPMVKSSRSVFETPPLIDALSFTPRAVVSHFDEQGAVTTAPTGQAGPLPVVGEAPQVSPVRRVVTAIPLVKRLFRNADFKPPTPSLSPLPEIPDSLSQSLKRELAVEVKVFVNTAGDVQYAELLTDVTGRDSELAALAVFESRRWKFHPAVMKGKPRDSEVILHYRFSPPAARE